jgi:hypothetical protein
MPAFQDMNLPQGKWQLCLPASVYMGIRVDIASRHAALPVQPKAYQHQTLQRFRATRVAQENKENMAVILFPILRRHNLKGEELTEDACKASRFTESTCTASASCDVLACPEFRSSAGAYCPWYINIFDRSMNGDPIEHNNADWIG